MPSNIAVPRSHPAVYSSSPSSARSSASAPTADLEQTVAARQWQDIAEGLRLFEGREAGKANVVPKDRTFDTPYDLVGVGRTAR